MQFVVIEENNSVMGKEKRELLERLRITGYGVMHDTAHYRILDIVSDWCNFA